jgi:hypothetical protein
MLHANTVNKGYGFHPIKNLRNCDQEFVAPFNSNFHNKTPCESGVNVDNSFHYIFIYRFSLNFFLCIILHFYRISLFTINHFQFFFLAIRIISGHLDGWGCGSITICCWILYERTNCRSIYIFLH